MEQLTDSVLKQSAAAVAGGSTMPYTMMEQINSTIAHGLGAPHHGTSADYQGPREIRETMKDWHVYDVDGLELEKPYTIKASVGRPGNESSGDTLCIMSYIHYYTWAAVGPAPDWQLPRLDGG